MGTTTTTSTTATATTMPPQPRPVVPWVRVRVGGVTKSYHSSPSRMSWEEALDYCQSMGASLPCVQSAQENAFLFKRFQQVWIGMNDPGGQDHWTWLPQCRSTYSNWYPGEPHSGSDGNCAAISSTAREEGPQLQGTWVVQGCDDPQGVQTVCERIDGVQEVFLGRDYGNSESGQNGDAERKDPSENDGDDKLLYLFLLVLVLFCMLV